MDAIQRPGASTLPLPDYGGAAVTDPKINAAVRAALPALLAQAPWGTAPAGQRGPGTWSPDARMAWLTQKLRQAGVPLAAEQHVMPSGQIVQDPGWWTAFGKPALIALSPGLAGWGLGAGAGGLGSTAGAADLGTTMPAATISAEPAIVPTVDSAALTIPGATAGMPAALPNATSAIPALTGAGTTAATTAAIPGALKQLAPIATKALSGGSTANTNQTTGGPDLTPLMALLPLIGLMIHQGSTQPSTPGQLIGSIPGGQDILNSVLQQNAQKAPLRQAVTQQAMNMLPNSAFPGGARPAIPQGPTYAPAAPNTSGGMDVGKMLMLLAGGGAATLGLAPWLKKLFGGGTPNLNAPQPGNNFPWQGPTQTTPDLNAPVPTNNFPWQGPTQDTPPPDPGFDPNNY